MTQKILVTGANKGIGFHICRQLSKWHASQNSSPVIYLGCRDEGRAKDAIGELKKEFPQGDFRFTHFDLQDHNSIKGAADSFKDGLDVLVNNAGMAYKGSAFNEEVARDTITTNTFGLLCVYKNFAPVMEKTAAAGQTPRIVTVASMAGRLGRYAPDLRDRMYDTTNFKDVENMMNEFVASVADETSDMRGWPHQTYGVAKAGQIAATRVLAKELQGKVFVVACCPGWCKTDMAGYEKPPKTAEQGADTPAWLCTGAPLDLHGGFYQERQPMQW